MLLAEVILPKPIQGTFTYTVPEEMASQVERGSRVYVQFGPRKYYTGIVDQLQEGDPQDKGYALKPILFAFDGGRPVVKYPQVKFWNWIADYYLCTLGEVYRAALPTGLKIESETYVAWNPSFELEEGETFTERQAVVAQHLMQGGRMPVSELENKTGLKNLGTVVNSLMDLGAVEIDECAAERYRPKKEVFVTLDIPRNDPEALHEAFEKCRRSPLRQQMLVAYISASKWSQRQLPLVEVTRQQLLDAVKGSPAVLKAMADKGIFRVYKKEINRFKLELGETFQAQLPELSAPQKAAVAHVHDAFRNHNVVLLRGATGSGKTEIYSHLIDMVMANGRQVLYLVPEIALTTQLTDRLRKHFGNRMLVYHSKFSDSERVDIYRQLLDSKEPLLVLGVRSSVFLPFSSLGLVIVDEEHESSYKQYDPAPRYNGRDAAIVLASMHGCKTLLGSATPSIETYYKACNGKYGLVELLERYGAGELPKVEIVDMKDQRRRKLNDGILSEPLRNAVAKALAHDRQAIMFQNRRGFAPIVSCKECGWTPTCVNCDVSLVYHKRLGQLRCHYCGYSISKPSVCPACGLPGIEVMGYGTERIAEEVDRSFNDYKVVRMDLDTTRNKNAYQQIIEEFASGASNVLVGTQMVSKGLDFGKVDVVGVINADTLLKFPDFRANERAFNMLTQVAGRAGRQSDRGEVYVQTTDPDNAVLAFVRRHDYPAFYEYEIGERQKYRFPPFSRIIIVTLRHKDREILDKVAAQYVRALQSVFGTQRVSGPEPPHVARISNYYILNAMLKIEAEASLTKVKHYLRQIYEQLMESPSSRSLLLHYDVDPV